MALCLSFGSAAASQSNVKVYVNNVRIDEKTILSDDRTYIPVRAVSEAMGANVMWDAASNSVFITYTEDDTIAKLVSDVSSSVVAIIGNYNGSGEQIKYNNPTIHGSGVIYKSDGRIITNAHVVKDIKNLTVVLSDGSFLPGRVLYSDEKADLAVVKIDKIGLNAISFANKSQIESGRCAIAIGTPISLSMRNTVTKGIVCSSSVTLESSFYKLIQTDASINPGNSGGALLNIKGELIGINSSKFAGNGIDNMAFAIPADTVEYAINEFEKYGKIRRPDFSITLENSWESKIGLPTSKGITVKSSNNPDIKAQDVITAVNGISVHSIADWNEALKTTYNGTSADVTFVRSGTEGTVNIKSN